MGLRKTYQIFSTFMLSVGTTHAVTVVQQTGKVAEPTNSAMRTAVLWIFGSMFIVLFIGFVIGIIALILYKIWAKISEFNRKKKNFFYDMFLFDATQCHNNRDYLMKFRNARRLWMFWKRSPVFTNSKDGLLQIGEYNGECMKKEGFYEISLFNKLSVFKIINQIIIIPNELKHIIKKTYVNKEKVLIIDCDGIDQVANTDYYFLPLVKDPLKPFRHLDFADQIHKEYLEKTTYREIIKDNLLAYKEGTIKAVETNPFVHFNRRKE